MSNEIDISTYVQHNKGSDTIHTGCDKCGRVKAHFQSICRDFWSQYPFNNADKRFIQCVTTTVPSAFEQRVAHHFSAVDPPRKCNLTQSLCLSYTVIMVHNSDDGDDDKVEGGSSPNSTAAAAAVKNAQCPNCGGFLDCWHRLHVQARKRERERSNPPIEEYVITSEFASFIDDIRFISNLQYYLLKTETQQHTSALISEARKSERKIMHFIRSQRPRKR